MEAGSAAEAAMLGASFMSPLPFSDFGYAQKCLDPQH